MNRNYTYIIASTPALSTSYKPSEGSVKPSLDWIRSQLDGKDLEAVDFIVEGFRAEKLDDGFYEKAFRSKIAFIRNYFATDLELRNAKVRYLNDRLGRPADTGIVSVAGAPQTEDSQKIAAIFTGDDLLARERAIDDFMWNKTEELTLFRWFKLENVLATVVKLLIIERWLSLDEHKGRELLWHLVINVRGTYGKIEFNTLK